MLHNKKKDSENKLSFIGENFIKEYDFILFSNILKHVLNIWNINLDKIFKD